MAKGQFKTRDLRVGDTVLVEVANDIYERKITNLSENHIKLDRKVSFIDGWTEVGRVVDVLDKGGNWENIEGTSVKSATKKSIWSRIWDGIWEW